MIIWGSTARDRTIASGTFYCPACRARSSYSHQRVSRYFTLYFIPLFPTDTLGEYLRCTRCLGQFNTFVATMSAEQVEALVRPWYCNNCANHNPSAEGYCVACGAPKGYVRPPAAADSRFDAGAHPEQRA
ncbi:MAG TPA: zinc-ribbon domain-containing protein [Longimicrobiaceae bacterium]